MCFREQLSQVFDEVVEVDVLDSRDQVNLALLTRPDLGITFTKLHCWRLTQYKKCVFMDADTLVGVWRWKVGQWPVRGWETGCWKGVWVGAVSGGSGVLWMLCRGWMEELFSHK